MAELIARCLEKNARDRHQSMDALADDLRALGEKLLGLRSRLFEPVDTPQPVEWAVNLSNTYHNLGLADEALKAAQDAVSLDAEHTHAWNALGNALALKKDYAEAVNAFLRAHGLSHSDLVSATNLVRCYFELGDADGATRWLGRVLATARGAEDVGQLETISMMVVELASQPMALEFCDRVLVANPRSAVTWNNRAILLRRAGRYGEALYSATRALDLNPAYAKAWSNRATALLHLGRYAEAVESADRAVEFDPTLAGPYTAKAAALMELGRKSEAESCLRRGLEEHPNHPLLSEALRHYGLA
jgi:tetratricopeptide (TPR) repeat protein